ncbi:AmmeMemoRadiSam system protein B [Bradyrhizobium canariense]|nr:AmmeMemoRadiSam system protein B [Bradyrhizobium canariense]
MMPKILRLAQCRCGIILLVFALLFMSWDSDLAAQGELPVPSLYPSAEPFVSAIASEKPAADLPDGITGIGVPHHLLAANLIARGFWTAANNSYARVIIIAPDHFSRSRRAFATLRRDFETPFGTLTNDRTATDSLLSDRALFDESDLFEKEHGIQALLPFVKHFFPNAKIVPVVASYGSTRADWDRAALELKKIADDHTLIVQSTDYSHYLPLQDAVRRDQETLNVIASGDLDAVNGLIQPDHLDSKAAQYMQMRIQAEAYSAAPTVIANRDSSDFGSLANTVTSYIVTAYAPRATTGSRLRYADQTPVYFGGDTFIGRWFTEPLADPAIARRLIERVRASTGGAPLIVNLEGVALTDPPPGLPSNLHAMHASLTVHILRALNVQAAGLANNHSHDLGNHGFTESVAVLKRAGIIPLLHMQPSELSQTGIVAINFIGVRDYRDYPVIKNDGQLEKLCGRKAGTPVVAFVHWGDEYLRDMNSGQYAAAKTLHQCGVSIIVGAHSHVASRRIESLRGGEYLIIGSVGNLIFDQRGDRASSALLELRRFAKGTVATRLIPIPNLYDFIFDTQTSSQGTAANKGD